MNNNLTIRAMEKDDDPKKVAPLIYETSDELFKALFGKKEKALPKIEHLIQLEHNLFSYKNTIVAVKENTIAGIVIGYDPRQVNKKAIDRDFKKALSFFARLRCWIVLNNSKHIMDFDNLDGFYIQNICVDSAGRGKRVGYTLLEQCAEMNRKKGVRRLYLDVESTNNIAVGLYKKCGFEIYRETKIKVAGVTLYRMRKALQD